MIPVGTQVRIRFEPGCTGEWSAHGTYPKVNGLWGIVREHPNGSGGASAGHDHWVFLTELGHHSWFRADELVPEGVQ